MYMDTEFPINVSHVTRVVDEADVFVIAFPLLAERLLVDARATPEECALVKVVPGVSSVQERYDTLRELRPNFPLPEKFTFFVWPRSVSALRRMSIWERIRSRVEASGGEARDACQEAFEELQRLEHRQVMAALQGDGFRSLYERGAEPQ